MTDQQIADQILRAVEKSVRRFMTSNPRTVGDQNKAIAAEFLSGANQVASFLVRGDGDFTPQQVERALKIAGESLGFALNNPG